MLNLNSNGTNKKPSNQREYVLCWIVAGVLSFILGFWFMVTLSL